LSIGDVAAAYLVQWSFESHCKLGVT